MSPLSAWALGLGQIRVLSQRDQPLLAEIPIISNDSAELEQLQARLASPDTFARIGLAPPQGIVSDLQFAVALDARGRPVVRVTSAAPVQQPLLTFLLEVDWGQGRLVREYSALLDTPQTAAAPAQPPIQEATVDAGNAIVRPEAPPPNPLADAAPTPVPLRPGEQTPATPADPLTASAPVAVPLAPDPLPAPEQPAATAIPVDVTAGGDTRVVRPGETLGGIAASLDRGFSLDQTIVALLRANPEAFIDGNANRLRAGAVLRIPDDAGIARYTPDEAALVVREQAAQWRGAGRALPQPPAVVGAPVGEATTASPTAAARPAGTARATAQARLEIMPPSASRANRAGTRSGVSAGGEGDMLRQQELQQQNQETLAAREAEVQELKARVAELEQLQQKQNQLIALKDSELAAAQQKLATTQAAAPPAGASMSGLGPWIGIAAGLVTIALLAVWWLRRRAAAPAAAPVRRDIATLAAAVPKADAQDEGAFVDDIAASSPDAGPEVAADPEPAEPAWNRLAKPSEPEPSKPAAPTRAVPTWHAGGAEVAPLNAAPPGQGRLDLAKAYLDMGDRDTARSLLQEVATRGDTVDVRRQAEQLLQDLG
ncbi:MAG: type IV pilus assembly protein FimV [Pseudomonadota bacterium]